MLALFRRTDLHKGDVLRPHCVGITVCIGLKAVWKRTEFTAQIIFTFTLEIEISK